MSDARRVAIAMPIGMAATLVGLLVADWFVCWTAGWMGAFALGVSAVGKPFLGVAPQVHLSDHGTSAILLLVLMALGMYLLAAYALTASVLASWRSPPSFAESTCKEIGVALAESTPPETARDLAGLTAQPIQMHRNLRGKLSDIRKRDADAASLLDRLAPRDLLGMEQIELALSAAIAARWRTSFSDADELESIGQFAAVAGLTSTVAGLIVAGVDLGNTAYVGTALSAALLKCFIGFGARLACLGAHERIYYRARHEEVNLLSVVKPLPSDVANG